MKANGFTLVELLVALIIFGLLSAAGVVLLSGSARVQEGVRDRLADVASLRRTNAIVAADLAQALPRPHRDEAGRPRPAFHATNGREASITFVRAGWDNEDGAARASIQRVQYRVSGGALERIAWPMVDGAAPMRAQRLLSPASGLGFRFRGADGVWRTAWDPLRPQELPRAVEIVVHAGKPLRMQFLVGSGQA